MASRIGSAVAVPLAKGLTYSFASCKAGTLLTANPEVGSTERLASFQPACEITAARDSLFAQRS